MNMTPKRLLITGFSGFPGVPVNPTEKLMARLPKRLRATPGVDCHYAVLSPSWSARDTGNRRIIEDVRPDAVVHFGADGTRRSINIEARAVNQATRARADAAGQRFPAAALDPHGPSFRASTLPVRRLLAAARRSGAAVDLSMNAGTYLCNATLWDTIGLGLPAVFVHVPTLPRGRNDRRQSYFQIEAAAVCLLQETAKLLR